MSESEVAVETEVATSDKELNFARLRNQHKNTQLELDRIKREKQELEQLRAREREELEALKARQKELSLEKELFAEEQEESPDEIVSVSKLKEKQKRLASQQAHVLQKMQKDMEKRVEEKIKAETSRLEQSFHEKQARETLLDLMKKYGEEAINDEVASNKWLAKAIDGRDAIYQAQCISEYMKDKEEAKKLLASDNRGAASVGSTGIGAGMMPATESAPYAARLTAKDINNPEAMQKFEQFCKKSLKR